MKLCAEGGCNVCPIMFHVHEDRVSVIVQLSAAPPFQAFLLLMRSLSVFYLSLSLSPRATQHTDHMLCWCVWCMTEIPDTLQLGTVAAPPFLCLWFTHLTHHSCRLEVRIGSTALCSLKDLICLLWEPPKMTNISLFSKQHDCCSATVTFMLDLCCIVIVWLGLGTKIAWLV